MKQTEISENILIADLIAAYPSTVTFLSERNLHCIICGEPVWGTLKELARDKNYSPEQLESLVEELKLNVNQLNEK
ncbi:MAG: hypothetical protein AB9834_03190 [Lentimicrobium sp.]